MGGARVAATLWTATIAVERRLRVGDFALDKVRNVLVIGGAGYIGSILVRELLRKGYHVRPLDILLFGDAPIAELYDHPRFELIKGDFRHIDVVVSAMQDVDAVIHLGAIVGDPACALDEETRGRGEGERGCGGAGVRGRQGDGVTRRGGAEERGGTRR